MYYTLYHSGYTPASTRPSMLHSYIPVPSGVQDEEALGSKRRFSLGERPCEG